MPRKNNMDDTATAILQKANPESWVKLHADYLYRYALSKVQDEQLAKDLVQETFLAALEKAANFKGDSTERTWLTAILRNKIIDVYRKRSSLSFQTEELANTEEEEFFNSEKGHWNPPSYPRPFGTETDLLTNKEFAAILQQCLKKLPGLWLSVFTMRLIDEEQTDTICKELKVTASNFWVIIHRAKVNLRSCLQKNWQ
jgi:RNA polymerase sigma-70 factor (TIGR02943 family)